VIIHDEMRTRIVVAASSRLGKDLSAKTCKDLEVIIHDEMRCCIVVAAASRLGKDSSAKTSKELEVIIHDEMRSRIVMAASSRLGTDFSRYTHAELDSTISGEMRWKGSQTECAKQSHVAGTSCLQVMKAIEKASFNLHPEAALPTSNTSNYKAATMDITGLEAAAVDVVSKWTEMHDTAESKDKAADPLRPKKGLRKGYDVLKKEMKEYEDALRYNRDTSYRNNTT